MRAFFRGLKVIYGVISEFGSGVYPNQERGLTHVMVGLDALGFQDVNAKSGLDRQRIRRAIRDFDVLRTQQQMNRDGLQDVREALDSVASGFQSIWDKLDEIEKGG